MFAQAWNIYFPVIKILIKRASSGEQTLAMNKTDFERAAGGRKAKLTFHFTLHSSRNREFNTTIPPVAREFILLLQEDPAARQLLDNQAYSFTMNSMFQLKIKKDGTDSPELAEAVAGGESEA